MRTRAATLAEKFTFTELRAASPNWAEVTRLARDFYARGGTFADGDAELHSAAARRWDAEVKAAGFHIARQGLRVVVA